jgi:hypothetical protein
MKRIRIHMDDPIFTPGVTKTIKVPVDVDPSGVSCQLEVFLGPNDSTKSATTGLKSFTSTGAQQIISSAITMPSSAGVAYHVYIDLYAEGGLLASYVADEDVIIPSGTIGPPTWE